MPSMVVEQSSQVKELPELRTERVHQQREKRQLRLGSQGWSQGVFRASARPWRSSQVTRKPLPSLPRSVFEHLCVTLSKIRDELTKSPRGQEDGKEASLGNARVGEGSIDSATWPARGWGGGEVRVRKESGFVAQMGIPRPGAFLQWLASSLQVRTSRACLLPFLKTSSAVQPGKLRRS